MNGSERREKIINVIKENELPVSAKKLAQMYDVSRQIIVQDIALLRAAGYDIISTNRGYLLKELTTVSRVFKVNHTDEEVEAELCAVVDLGGNVVNVSVHHKIYGVMEAPLHINSRRKIKEFMKDLESGKSSPLKNITSGYHYHKIEAESEEILDEIERTLQEKQYLIERE